MTKGITNRRAGVLLRVALALLPSLLLAGCAPTTGPGPVPVRLGEVTRPEWVDTGRHPAFPASTHISAVRTGIEGLPPGRDEMIWRLCERLQVLVAERLEAQEAGEIARAARRGLWVGPQHLPIEHFVHQQWTDGFQSMGICAVPQGELGRNAREMLARRPSVLNREPERWAMRSTPMDDMQDRVRLYSEGTDELVLRILAGVDLAASTQIDTGLIASANRLYKQAADFRDFVGFHILTGGNQRVELGRQPAPIECQFVWNGAPAQGLPLRAILSAQEGSGPRVTDSIGTATLRFSGPAKFTGAESNPVGFDLAWDMLIPYGETGIVTTPFTTSLTMPAIGNTIVALTLTEKVGNRTLTNGPIRRAIHDWLRSAGMVVIEVAPARDELNFVLEIGGVVSVTEMDRAGASAIRQVQASGTVLLRTWAGPVLATVSPIEGLGRYVIPASGRDSEAAREALDAAGLQALEDAWGVWRATVGTRFREPFPPIFPQAAEDGPKATLPGGTAR